MRISPQRLSLEDFPDQRTWLGKLFSQLNQFNGDVTRAFSNSFSIEDNLFQEVKEIKFVNSAASFPLKFIPKFKSAPIGITPIYLQNVTLGSYSLLAPWVVWKYQDGQVIISDISGLTTATTYNIRLLCIYG